MKFKNPFKKKTETRSLENIFSEYFYSTYWNESQPSKISYLNSLENEAVWTCSRAISEAISNFPINVYEKKENTRIGRSDYFLSDVLREPNEYNDSKIYWQTVLQHLLIKGNSYSYIKRDQYGKVSALYILDPEKMKVKRYTTGRIEYNYEGTIYRKEEIFHIVGFSSNSITGISPVDQFKLTILEGINADKFLSNFWLKGNFSKLGYKFPAGEKLTPEKINGVKSQFRKFFLGLDNSYEPIIYPDGTELKEFKGYSLKDDDILNLRKQANLKVGSIYSVPPHKLNILDNANYSNVTAFNEEFYKTTLSPWVVRIEKAIEKQLIPSYDRKKIYVKFNEKSLLRGSDKDRAEYYRLMHNQGFISVNEVRELEDRNKLQNPEADYHFIPVNTVAIEKYNELNEKDLKNE